MLEIFSGDPPVPRAKRVSAACIATMRASRGNIYQTLANSKRWLANSYFFRSLCIPFFSTCSFIIFTKQTALFQDAMTMITRPLHAGVCAQWTRSSALQLGSVRSSRTSVLTTATRVQSRLHGSGILVRPKSWSRFGQKTPGQGQLRDSWQSSNSGLLRRKEIALYSTSKPPGNHLE